MRAPPGGTTSAVRRRYRRMSGAVVVVLAGINVTDHFLHPPWWVRAVEGGALLTWARLDGLTWSQLGLSRDRLRSGLRWGLGAVGVIGAVYVVGILLPPFRPLFQDARYDVPLADGLRTVFVTIPFGTVVLEELAFRSVLWGALSRHMRQWQVLATTSVLFGFWHVLPSLNVGSSNKGVGEAVGTGGLLVTGGAVLLTTLGGLVFGELRRRSGSVVASALAHWAFNALGVLFGLVAWRIDPSP